MSVYTDDPKHPKQILRISGSVKNIFTLNPRRVLLRGNALKPIKRRVKITPDKKYIFKIIGSRSENGEKFQYKLEENTRSGFLEYLLTVENLQHEVGDYIGSIILQTDSKIRPQINISVIGSIYKNNSKRKQTVK